MARPGPRELRTGGGGRSHLDTLAGGGPRQDARSGQRAAGGGELIGREIGPAGALAAAGSPLCLGSDSNAVVDLFEEARTVELDERLATGRRAPTGPTTSWPATEAGMAALGWNDGHHLLQVADVPAAHTHAIAALDQR